MITNEQPLGVTYQWISITQWPLISELVAPPIGNNNQFKQVVHAHTPKNLGRAPKEC